MGEPTPDKPGRVSSGAKKVGDAVGRISRVPYTKGLPEWDMFPSDEARLEAAEAIEATMMPRSWRALFGFLLVVLPSVLGPLILFAWLRKILIPQGFPHDDLAVMGLAIVAYCVIIAYLIRRGMPRDLRRRLIKCGVPVCIRCGYALRGLPADRTRCPECGRRLSPAVRALIRDAAADAG